MAHSSQDLPNDPPQLRQQNQQQQQQATLPQMVAAIQEGVRMAISSQTMKRQDNTEDLMDRGPARITPPPLFNGEGARNWLLQIELFHKFNRRPEEGRIADAVQFLTGPALADYALLASQGDEPQTWEEFRAWLLQRFSHRSEAETVRRLQEVKWQGSLDQLCNRFADIVSQGVPLSQIELQRLFVRALPLDLVVLFKRTHFDTWLQMKDYLIRETAPQDHWVNIWLTSVPQDDILEAWQRTPHLFPVAFQQKMHRQQGAPRLFGAVGAHGRPTTPRGALPRDFTPSRGYDNPRNTTSANLRCNICNAPGHLARQCPNLSDLIAKDNSKCSRCGGIGHWARDCPTRPGLISTTNHQQDNGRTQNLNGGVRKNPTQSGNGRA